MYVGTFAVAMAVILGQGIVAQDVGGYVLPDW
jgi:hypothetical protein